MWCKIKKAANRILPFDPCQKTQGFSPWNSSAEISSLSPQSCGSPSFLVHQQNWMCRGYIKFSDAVKAFVLSKQNVLAELLKSRSMTIYHKMFLKTQIKVNKKLNKFQLWKKAKWKICSNIYTPGEKNGPSPKWQIIKLLMVLTTKRRKICKN